VRVQHGVESDWWELPQERRDAILTWMGAFVDPQHARSVTLVGEGQVEVERIPHGPNGRPVLDPDGTLPVYLEVVPIRQPPPPEWWD